MTVLVFDSGVGGLTVFREARVALPEQSFVYVGDDAGFPYGEWDESALIERIVALFDLLMNRFSPSLAIIACNTASTLIMPALRERYDLPFVGIVPAIKPAAEQTASGLISVLATPGTVKRPHIRSLIEQFAADREVNLVGATRLARMAELHLQGKPIDHDVLAAEISACFVTNADRRTDIIALGCTHYPFLVNEMRKIAPWPVDWLDPAAAVARRARELMPVGDVARHSHLGSSAGVAAMTSGAVSSEINLLLASHGLSLLEDFTLPADLRLSVCEPVCSPTP